MRESEQLDELYKALDDFHTRSPLVKAEKENPFLKNKYADYNTIVASTRKDLVECGLRVKQTLTSIDSKTAVRTRLIHLTSNQFIEDVVPVAHKDADPQSQGSGITYVKRYAYVAMLDLLVDKDDDGNLAAGLGKAAEKTKAIDGALSKLDAATSEEELKKAWISLGSLASNKEVYAFKESKKRELVI